MTCMTLLTMHNSFRLLLVALLALPCVTVSPVALAEQKSGRKVDAPGAVSMESLRQRAQRGDASAQIDLGYKYQQGEGVPTDLPTACAWFKKASDQGDPIGQCNYGTMLIYGWGCKQDQAAAKALFEKALTKKCKYAYYELGVIYEQGLGVKPDYDKAFEYYKKAALLGVPQAINNLASMRAHGQLKADWTPLEMYKQSALAGDSTAEFNIGMLYLDGDGVKQSDKLAVEWLTKAAQHGNMHAQCNLGVVLAAGGKGVPVQTEAAIKWLRLAADKGDNVAKQGLARIYREGRGVPKNPKEADRWWPHPLP